MSRGISPIVSIVLLLMMTVTIGATAFFWMSDMANTMSNRAERMSDTEFGRMEFDIKVVDYDLGCNNTDDDTNYATSAQDGEVVSNITIILMGYGSTTTKTLETISIGSVAIDGAIVADGDYLEGLDVTIQSGELLKIMINNTGTNGVEPAYITNLFINETDQDATADNPLHEEDVTFLFSTDRGTAKTVTLTLDANDKCL